MNNEFTDFLKKYPARTFNKQQVILRPENGEKQIYIIHSGFVRAHTMTEEGNEFSAMLLGAGTYFPIFRYFSDPTDAKQVITKYYYSAVTKTEVTIINHLDLVKFLQSHQVLANEISYMYYTNIKLLLTKLEFMVYTHSAYKKVCYFLLFLTKKFGQKKEKNIDILPTFTHKEFATFVGLSRESVSHQLSILKKKGILKTFNPSIRIESTEFLENELTN